MKILIVDDHQLFLDGFSFLLKKLDANADIQCCSSGEAALKRIDKSALFDLIILDIGIPDIDGLTVFSTIRKQGVLTPVVFVSATENIRTMANAIHLGASGVISKQYDSATMLRGLREVLNGDIFIHEELAPYIEQELENIADTKNSGVKLTKRQHEVLRIMSNGASSKEIARLLSISEATVKTHIGVIFQTLNTANRLECVRKAESMGLLDSV